MAHKKKETNASSSFFWTALTTIAALIGGAGATGWVMPDLPWLGPRISALASTLGLNGQQAQAVETTKADANRKADANSWIPSTATPGIHPPSAPTASIAYAAGSSPSRLEPTPASLPAPAPANVPLIAPVPPMATTPPQAKPSDAVLIASFNIQVFGESKMAKPEVVDVLARVVRTFDIVAIQEVRAKSDAIIPEFVRVINADGSRYQHVIGPRLGRTVSKEQYTFIYDTNRIELDTASVGTIRDPADRLHRPPMYARFRVRTTQPERGFSFWMVDTHTDPDEVSQEVDALADVFVVMRSARPDEDDVILLGDLNASPMQFGRIKKIPSIGWAISGVPTNTRRTKTYDNLIFDPITTREYTGRWGVVDLQNTFGLSIDKALQVSDHNPVWAAFSPWELPASQGALMQPAAIPMPVSRR